VNFTVVKYSSEYRQDVLELQKHLWNPQMEINDDYLSWKYENNPYLDERLIYLILADERVVGMRGAWGSSWQMGQEGEALPVACVGDLVIEPEHRDKGLYKKSWILRWLIWQISVMSMFSTSLPVI
jgi:GNAT superfamily N-acetyltransferase